MEQPKNLNPIINLLGQHEEIMAQLYQTYAAQFPDPEFWQNLAQAEHVHYRWVKSLSTPHLKNIYLDEAIFQSAGIETSINYIKELIAKASNHTLINALSYALDIETAMIEKGYFKIFKSDSPKVNQILTVWLKNYMGSDRQI